MIPKEFQNTISLNKRFSLIQYETTRYWSEEDYNNGSEELFNFEINEETGNTYINDIGISFDEEYNKHLQDELYFIGCPFSIYKSTYINRMQKYLIENEADLYNKNHFVQQEMLDALTHEISPYLNLETKHKLKKSTLRRKEFLKTELNSLGYKFKVSLNEIGKINSVAVKDNSIVIIEETNIDLSSSKDVDKIRLLGLIGFFDFIKKNEPNLNVSQIATLLSSITGVTQNTIQSYINPILGNEVSQEKLPCFTLNFSFNGKKANANIKASTGFIYLDLDNETDIDLTNKLIFVSWKSLSNNGRGILVKVDGLSITNFKSTYLSIANELNINVDKNANKPTQYCIHSYDKDIYVNDDSITYQCKDDDIKYTPITGIYYKRKKKG